MTEDPHRIGTVTRERGFDAACDQFVLRFEARLDQGLRQFRTIYIALMLAQTIVLAAVLILTRS